MEDRRGSNTWLVAALAVAVGFLAALLIFGGDDDADTTNATVNATTAETTQTTGAQTQTTETQVTTPEATPGSPEATPGNCIALWNQRNNRAAQTFLVNIASQQPVRIHVGTTSDVPAECLVTVVANNGDAYTFAEGGGTTFPYAPAPARTTSDTLPEEQRTANALNEPDGRLKER